MRPYFSTGNWFDNFFLSHLLTHRYAIFQGSSIIRQILLRIAVDVDDARFVTLGDAAFGRDEFDRVPLYACGVIRSAATDTDIPAGIADGHVAVEIADFSVYLHVGEGCIGDLLVILINLFQQLGLFRRRERLGSIHLILHRLLSGGCQIKFGFLRTGSFVLHQKSCRFGVVCAVNFLKVCRVCFDIDAVDLGVGLGRVARCNGFGIVSNLSSLFAHNDIVQLQVGVRFVCDGDAGGCVGTKVPRAGKVIGRYIDIAAAGGDVRDFHKIYGSTGAGINPFPLIILLCQSQTYHVVLDSVALGDVGR